MNISNSPGGSLSPAIFVKNNTIYVVWYEYIMDNLEIMYSNKIGDSWSEPINISNTSEWSWFPEISGDEDSIYVVWSEYTFPNSEIYFYSFPYCSVWIDENPDSFYDSFGISYNFPNPFNSTTTINYALSKDSYVELKIYNIRGQLINTLLSAYQLAGNHSIVWGEREMNENKLPSGVYFYCLKFDDIISKVKKMMLIR